MIDKQLIYKIYKQNMQTAHTTQCQNINNTIKNAQKRTDTLPSGTWKKCSTSLVIRKMQVRTTVEQHCSIAMGNERKEIPSVGEDVEQQKALKNLTKVLLAQLAKLLVIS